MTALVYGFICAGVLVFLAACAMRTARYAKMPAHLRWELYPVPHEDAARASHGGSYFEELDWWTKSGRYNFMGEMKAMAPEMLFLKGLWEFNRPLWWRSFPFHFGLYLLAAATGLLLLSATTSIFVPAFTGGAVERTASELYRAAGLLGTALALLGAVGLLHRRLTDGRLKNYTSPGDLFNLAFFIGTLSVLSAGYLTRGPRTPRIRDIVRGLLTWDTTVEIPAILAGGFILGALLLAYIPLTHMSHFIAKYFTYHNIRWDDVPAWQSAELRKRCAEYLTYRPTWSAPHIAGDGRKTWVDVATANPFAGTKK